jgi:[glutamine synthetase] adenylyltransferase / [glutamine synthetase]-adenylyl-L-tyrosine phosphorylase
MLENSKENATTNDLRGLARSFGCSDVDQAERNLQSILTLGLPDDLIVNLFQQLAKLLAQSTDADRVLGNLERFAHASLSPQALLALFEREPESLATLVQLFATSQYMADQLIKDPVAFDLLRMTDGQPVQASLLADEISAEVNAATEVRQVMRAIRGFRHRENLRIAYGDFIGGLPVEIITEQLSSLADAILQAAVAAARREMEAKRAAPKRSDGRPARFAVIALGKLGGAELNYSSDVDLLMVCDEAVEPSAWRGMSIADYWERLAQWVIRFLSEATTSGVAYRVDMRLRPGGTQAPLVITASEAVRYYDSSGRTWERQAFVKARAVAGDLDLGRECLAQLQPWVYRRYLNRADITGIAALKRRIEKQASAPGQEKASSVSDNVKLFPGGIRDIEFVIQFLQLLNGGDLPALRESNTLRAIQSLEQEKCLTMTERESLSTNYRFARRLEHYLQIMFDLKAHTLPTQAGELQLLAMRMGYRDRADLTAGEQLLNEWTEKATLNRQIFNHLLRDAIEDQDASSAEADLLLDPEPDEATIVSVLAPFGFQDPKQAYRHLLELSRESIAFLSTRRCRHFLSAIATRLLTAIGQTPNPDSTLVNLAHVSDSLGGKAVLWELFSANTPSMELCIRLCACSPYLVSILTSNPGMIDELMDSLMLDCLPSYDELDDDLTELCRRAEDNSPILHSFKNSMHLRVGVRDILGKEQISATHATLSDIAEVCLKQVVETEYHRLVQRIGVPICGGNADENPRAGSAAELVVLAVGKLGGREPNYHSDLEVLFLFDGEGSTRSLIPTRRFEPTTNRHFFNQLSQRIIHAVTRTGVTGRLYNLDVGLRPLGNSGELAITINDLRTYFEAGAGKASERQALCQARTIWGGPLARETAIECVHQVIKDTPHESRWAEEIFEERLKLETSASRDNLKRGVGGTMDIEYVVQMLQLYSAAEHPNVLVPGTLDAIHQLGLSGKLDQSTVAQLQDNYRFLRSIESGIRLMNTSARHDLPTAASELKRLGVLINYREKTPLDRRCQEVRRQNREIFDRIFSEYLPAEET